jgi:hypothetical protein
MTAVPAVARDMVEGYGRARQTAPQGRFMSVDYPRRARERSEYRAALIAHRVGNQDIVPRQFAEQVFRRRQAVFFYPADIFTRVAVIIIIITNAVIAAMIITTVMIIIIITNDINAVAEYESAPMNPPLARIQSREYPLGLTSAADSRVS